MRTARPRRGLLLGLAFGGAYFGIVLYWILLFGELGWAALVLLSAASTGLFGFLAPALWRAAHPLRSTLGLAALWTVLGFVRGSWPLGGFGWGELGTTQAGNPFLLPLASVGGVWAITFVVIAVSGLLLVALERGRGVGPSAALAPAVLAVALAFAPVAIPLAAATGPAIDVAAIQVDVREARGLPRDAEDIAVARMNIDLHAGLAADPPDLAVWGEGSLDPAASSDPTTLEAVSGVIRTVGAPTLAGAVLDDPDGSQHTSVLLFDGRGDLVDRYDKVKLVPFGEYVPFRRRLEWIQAIDQIPVDRVPGETAHTVAVQGIPAFGTPICYENSFPAIEREMVRRGAQFFVLTTNNASYGTTAASRQHLLMSRVRAVETGRWIVHAAVSGISAVIDPRGRVVAESGLFETTVTRHEIRASTVRTLYVRLGDWVVWLSLALCVGLLLLPRGRGRPVRAEELPPAARTLVLLPTYNERATIGTVLDGLLGLAEPVDLLVIDDGSPDGTAGAVRERAEVDPRVRLLQRASKSGLASAYLAGFRTALDEGYELVVEMDSDLSHLPEQLPRLLTTAREHHMVIGSRYVPGGAVANWNGARLLLSRGGNLYARLCLGFPLHDATSGFRVYRRGLLEHLLERPVRSDGYGFQIELAYRAWRDGYDVAEAPITFREREHGHSKISRRIVLEALWLVTVWGVRARFRPS